MLSLLLVLVLIASSIMLIFAVSNYIKYIKKQQKFMNMIIEQEKRKQEYTKLYNEYKKRYNKNLKN